MFKDSLKIGLLTILCFLAGCEPEESQSWQHDSSAIKLKTSVVSISPIQKTTPQDDNNQTAFRSGDIISVSNGGSFIQYTTDNGLDWAPVSDQYLKWTEPTMQFKAFYPVSAGMDAFRLPARQDGDVTDGTYIGFADYMVYSGEQDNSAGKDVDLLFTRQTARIVVMISAFGSEYGETVPVVSSLKVVSPGSSLEEPDLPLEIIPYKGGDRYVALVLPGNTEGLDFIHVSVEGKTMSVKGVSRIEAGFSYQYLLKVGKDAIGLDLVSVEPWKESVIEPVGGGEMVEKGLWVDDSGLVHISTAEGLLEWASMENVLSTDVKLEQDIDMAGKRWIPLGKLSEDPSEAYTGDFDGNGKVIGNLSVEYSGNYSGFFAVVGNNAHIHDLTIQNGEIISTAVNGVCGLLTGLNGGKIEDCSVSGKVSGFQAGGVAGNNSVQISRCSSENVVIEASGPNCQAGGVAAQNYGTIRDCSVSGESTIRAVPASNNPSAAGGLVGTNTYGKVGTTGGRLISCSSVGGDILAVKSGGIVGENEFGTLEQCWAQDVSVDHPQTSPSSYLGGIVGVNTHGDIIACHSLGAVLGDDISSSMCMGGICGADNGHSTNRTHLFGCYSSNVSMLGSLQGEESGKGLLVGYANANSVVWSCYALSTIPGTSELALVGNAAAGSSMEYCVSVGTSDYGSLVSGVPDLTTLDNVVWKASRIWRFTSGNVAPLIDETYLGE